MFLKCTKTASRLADWIEQNIPEGLVIFLFPMGYRRLLRTNNCPERLNREICRRNRVMSIFPNETAYLRLISAILMEASDELEGGKAYLTFKP